MGSPVYNNFQNLITFSRGTNATLFDSTGKLTFGANNLLVNTATLSTQTVNTNLIAGCDVILSFKGTGSVAISGGYTGTLAGTGASDRVSLKFTTTTTSLTFTVTGTVTEAQLERVTYQTTPSTYNASTASQFFGPRLDYDPVTLALRGMLVEEQRTNLALTSTFATLAGSAGSQYPSGTGWSNFFNTGGTRTYVASSVFAGGQAMDISGVSSARNIIGFSFAPSASTTYTVSFYVESVSGVTGTVAYATGNLGTGGTTNLVAAPTTTGRYSYTFTTGTTPGTVDLRFGIGAAANESGSIRISNVQCEAGSFATSYIPTGASSVTRNADNATMSGSQFTPWYNGTQGTFVIQANSLQTPGVLQSFFQDGNLTLATNGAGTLSLYNGGTYGNLASSSGIGSSTFKAAAGYTAGASASGFSVNGAAPVAFTSPGLPPQASFAMGTPFSGTGFGARSINGYIRSITYYPRRLSNTQLQRLTA